MRRVLKKQIQEMVRRIDFPIIAYIYETGRIAAVSLRARFIIGENISNINLIWEQHGKVKFPEEILENGRIIKNQMYINCNNDRIIIDGEFIFIEIGEEHLVLMVFEQSYKKCFEKRYRQKIPRIFWCNKKLEIIGCNQVARNEVIPLKGEHGDKRKRLSQQRRVMESEIGQFDIIEEITMESGIPSFVSMNRILLTNRNATCIGVLSIYTLILSMEEEQEIIDDAYRENYILNEAVLKGRYIAVSWNKGSEGFVGYISPNVRILGYTPGDFYSRKIKWKDLVVSEDYACFENKNNNPDNFGGDDFFIEYRIKKRNGEVVWVRDETKRFTIKDNINYRQGIVYTIEEPGLTL